MKLMTVVSLTVCHQHPRPHSPATTGDQTGPSIYSWSNLGLGALHPPCRQGLCPLPTTHTLSPGLCPLLLGSGLGQEGLPNFLEGNSMPAPSRYISSLDGERTEGRREKQGWVSERWDGSTGGITSSLAHSNGDVCVTELLPQVGGGQGT